MNICNRIYKNNIVLLLPGMNWVPKAKLQSFFAWKTHAKVNCTPSHSSEFHATLIFQNLFTHFSFYELTFVKQQALQVVSSIMYLNFTNIFGGIKVQLKYYRTVSNILNRAVFGCFQTFLANSDSSHGAQVFTIYCTCSRRFIKSKSRSIYFESKKKLFIFNALYRRA